MVVPILVQPHQEAWYETLTVLLTVQLHLYIAVACSAIKFGLGDASTAVELHLYVCPVASTCIGCFCNPAAGSS